MKFIIIKYKELSYAIIDNMASSLNPQLIPIKYDAETIRKMVLSNILKMLNARGHVTLEGIKKHTDKFSSASDDNIYKIELNKPIISDGNDTDFEGKYTVVKYLTQKVTSIKIPAIKEFLDGFHKQHKIFVFENISDKARKTLMMTYNTEVFNESFFMINLIEHVDSPTYELLSEDETKKVLEEYNSKKNQIMRMFTSDPVSMYFNLKRGQIIRVIRYSEQTGKSPAYRIVVKPHV